MKWVFLSVREDKPLIQCGIYIASLVANRESDEYVRVKVDTENYRKRRKETLENLAKNIAFKVKKTRKPVSR